MLGQALFSLKYSGSLPSSVFHLLLSGSRLILKNALKMLLAKRFEAVAVPPVTDVLLLLFSSVSVVPNTNLPIVLFDKILFCSEYRAPNIIPLLLSCLSHSFLGFGMLIGVIKANITSEVIIRETIFPAPAFLSVALFGSTIPSNIVTANLKSIKTPMIN